MAEFNESMCQGLKHSPNVMCPLRWDCQRFMATPKPKGQAYFNDAPFHLIKVQPHCDYFMKVEKQ